MSPIDLMLKFLEGTSTPEENSQLDAWLREKPAHLELFEEIRLNWRSRPQHTSRAVQAYERVSRRLGFPEAPVSGSFSTGEKAEDSSARETRVRELAARETYEQGTPVRKRSTKEDPGRVRSGKAGTRRLLPWAAAVAGFLLLAFSGYYFFLRDAVITYSTEYAEIKTFLLPDSTLVTLNANSTLTLSGNWTEQENRHVALEGEAFFEVKQKRKGPASDASGESGTSAQSAEVFKKFIVSTDNLEVEVLGTAFNVNSRNRETKVALNTGSIRLKLHKNEREILMQPGDFVEVALSEEPVIRKGVNVANYSTWKEGKLFLDGSTIPELKALLRDNYGIIIHFEAPALSQEVRLRGTFPSTSPDLLLKAIADVTHTEPVTEGNRIYYKRKDKQK